MHTVNYLGEIWKPVLGYEGLYEVSNLGRVKSLNYNHTKKCRILVTPLGNGYMQVALWKNRKSRLYKVHRIVWEAFNGPIPDGMQVNHINEVKTDNRLCNLNLMTPKQNVNWGTGMKRRAVKRRKVIVQKTLDGQVVRIWPSQTSIVNAFKISTAAHISECCHGKRPYAHGFIWCFDSPTETLRPRT